MIYPLFYFALLLGLLPIAILLTRKNLTSEARLLKPFIWLIMVASFYEFFITYMLQVAATVWFAVYGILEFACIYYLFYKLLKGKYNLFLYFFAALFALANILLQFRIIALTNLQKEAYLVAIATVFTLIGTVLWFKELFSSLEVPSLTKSPVFYFITGLVIYFSGTLFLFLIEEHFIKNDDLSLSFYWNLIAVFNIILRILISIGIWKGHQKSVQYSG